MNRPRVLHGRLPTASARDGAVDARGADRLGVRIGDTLQLTLTGPAALATGGAAPTPIRVVGRRSQSRVASRRSRAGLPPLGAPDADVLPRPIPTRTRSTWFGCATARAASPRSIASSPAVAERAGRHEQSHRDDCAGATRSRRAGDRVAAARRRRRRAHDSPARPGARAARTLEADDDDVLRGLGFAARRLRLRAFGRGVAIGVAAAAIATVTAVLLSRADSGRRRAAGRAASGHRGRTSRTSASARRRLRRRSRS